MRESDAVRESATVRERHTVRESDAVRERHTVSESATVRESVRERHTVRESVSERVSERELYQLKLLELINCSTLSTLRIQHTRSLALGWRSDASWTVRHRLDSRRSVCVEKCTVHD